MASAVVAALLVGPVGAIPTGRAERKAPTKSTEAKKRMKTYTVEGLAFEAPEEGIAVDKMGVNCWEVRLASGAPGTMTVWVDLVVKSKEQADQIPGDKMQYFKMTYLGADRPSEKKVSRKFGAKTLEGDLHQSDMPVPSRMEIYRMDLPDGSVAALSFARANAFDAASAETFHAQIASTLRPAK